MCILLRRRKDTCDLVAEQVNDSLEIELRDERLLDIVEDGKLAIALARLFEQALRLGEQAGIFQRYPQAGCQRAQQAHV